MVHGLDESFDGLILLGYHAKFGTQNAILDHTFSPSMIRDLRVNGVSVGELGFNALFAAEKGVPLIMATGDQSLEKEAKDFYQEVETVVVKYAEGRFCARCLPRIKCFLTPPPASIILYSKNDSLICIFLAAGQEYER